MPGCAAWARGSASAAIRRRDCCCCSTPARPSSRSFCRRRRPAVGGSADSTRHARFPRDTDPARGFSIRSPRTAPHCWSIEILDASLIDRLERLRGIGEAYHDYRGELRYFTLETKAGILRAMGCSPEDPAALAAEIGQLEGERQRRLLPSMAAGNGKRGPFELNIPARGFASRPR